MRISREARILFAIVAVAAAAWVWVNYYNQPAPELISSLGASLTSAAPNSILGAGSSNAPDGSLVSPLESGSPAETATTGDSAAPSVATDAPTVPASAPVAKLTNDNAASNATAEVAAEVAESASPESATGSATDSAMSDGAAASSTPEGSALGDQPTVAPAPSVATRDIEVVELPFLITSPPPTEVQDDLNAAAELALTRPSNELRATINPFSPILLAPPPAEAVAQPSPAEPVSLAPAPTEPNALSVVTEVPIPAGPPGSGANAATPGTATLGTANAATPRSEVLASAPGSPSVTVAASAPLERVVAPAPQPLTPASPIASNLPRTLPSGTLSATPDLLRPSRSPALASSPEPTNLAAVAAISVPSAERPTLSLSEVPSPSPVAQAPQEDDLSPILSSGPGNTAPSSPVAVGATELSRYLRDQNYRFTGSVVGPVGVGVFRVGESLSPIVVPLGQTIPTTDIVLTSLQGKQAELTQENDTQVLVLDLR